MNLKWKEIKHISVDGALPKDFPKCLETSILLDTGYEYTCSETPEGYMLRPTFCLMPYKNSFVPEIAVVVDQQKEGAILRLTAQLVRSVRTVMKILMGFGLSMLALLLVLAVSGNLNSPFVVLVDVAIILYGFVLAKLGLKFTFRKIAAAIQRELS